MALKLPKYFATTDIKHLQTLPQPSSAFTLNPRTYIVHISFSKYLYLSLLRLLPIMQYALLCFFILNCQKMFEHGWYEFPNNMPKLCIVLTTYIYCFTCTIPVSPPAASSCPSDRKLPEYACNQHRSWETINVWAEPNSLYTMQHHLVGNTSIPNNHLKSFISAILLSICSSRRFVGVTYHIREAQYILLGFTSYRIIDHNL